MKFVYIASILFFATSIVSAQKKQSAKSADYLKMSWGKVATQMPSEWYGSDEAKLVAENVLLAQKEIGGWEKNKPYHQIFSDSLKSYFIQGKSGKGGTFDNSSTTTELRFLAKVYSRLKDERYKKAFEKGLDYIFVAQYENGGWPQYFPVKDAKDEILLDHTEPYSMHITYNDNAMVNIMEFLKDIFTNNKEFSTLQISRTKKENAKMAFDKGVQCMLKTQIVVDNKPTVWCAQHDEKTLAPANARAYELASFSGGESVANVLMLMELDHPSKEIVASVEGAVNWFETLKIEGIRLNSFVNNDGLKDREVVKDESAPTLWARFYDLETEKPYFCDRDGIKRKTFAELGYNRRNGYSWYTTAPQMLLRKYPGWKKNLAQN